VPGYGRTRNRRVTTKVNAERPPNVLLVVMDAARLKSLGAGVGHRVAHTPVLDRLAIQGTRFTRAIAPANWTIPAHMSMLTGTYPSTHGARTFRRAPSPFESIASWLQGRGYQTAVMTEQLHLVGGYGLEQGYEGRFASRMLMPNEERHIAYQLFGGRPWLYSAQVRKLVERLPPTIVPLNAINHPGEVAFKQERCGQKVVTDFRSWIQQRDPQRPLHALVNVVDCHEPYPEVRDGSSRNVLGRWYSRTPRYYLLAVPGLQQKVPWDLLEAGYRRCLEDADHKLGQLLETLEQSGELGRTLVIATADHGQSFGEGGNVFHGCGATESITRVPLVIVPPAGVTVPEHVTRWTSLCEIPAWIKATVTGHAPYGPDGLAPFPFSASVPDPGIVYSEGGPASDQNRSLRGIRTEATWNQRLVAAYRGEEKFLLNLATDRLERWTLDADPDVTPGQPLEGDLGRTVRREVFGRYEEADQRRIATHSGVQGVEVELDKYLRSWGYD
jgi:arylsulfatase A-like enzyme